MRSPTCIKAGRMPNASMYTIIAGHGPASSGVNTCTGHCPLRVRMLTSSCFIVPAPFRKTCSERKACRTQSRHGNAAPFGIRTTGAVSLHFPIARLRQSVGMSTAESPAIPDVSRTSMAIAALSTVVEWYDFTLYLYFATVLSRVFFGGGARSLLATLAGFAIAYGMRPLGAMVFGHIGDRIGRQRTLMLSMMLMTLAMLATALLPDYAAIGPASGVLLLLLRCFMAFSVGGEYTSVVAYLLEGARGTSRLDHVAGIGRERDRRVAGGGDRGADGRRDEQRASRCLGLADSVLRRRIARRLRVDRALDDAGITGFPAPGAATQ